jgi:hypothetical protein
MGRARGVTVCVQLLLLTPRMQSGRLWPWEKVASHVLLSGTSSSWVRMPSKMGRVASPQQTQGTADWSYQ